MATNLVIFLNREETLFETTFRRQKIFRGIAQCPLKYATVGGACTHFSFYRLLCMRGELLGSGYNAADLVKITKNSRVTLGSKLSRFSWTTQRVVCIIGSIWLRIWNPNSSDTILQFVDSASMLGGGDNYIAMHGVVLWLYGCL